MKLKIFIVTVFLFLCLPAKLPVSAADAITPADRADMIRQIDAKVSENLKQQKSEFTIVVEGDLNLADSYFVTEEPLNKFFDSSENAYYRTIKKGQKWQCNFNQNIDPFTSVTTTRMELSCTMEWEETYEQTQAVISYVRGINAKVMNSSMTGYQKVKALHDYFLDTYSYDLSFADNTPYYLVNNRSYVCENYTALFHQALREAGFPARLVLLSPGGQPSTANGTGTFDTHAWNMVQLDGKWYHIDLTWDENGKKNAKEKYRYFLKSSAFFKTEHRWDEALYPSAPSDFAGESAPVSSKSTASKTSSQIMASSSSSEESKISSEISSEPVSSELLELTSSQETSNKKGQPGAVFIIGGIAVLTASGAGALVYFFVLKK